MTLTLFILKIFKVICVSVFLHIYLCAMYVCSTGEGQKRLLGPLELELQTVVSPHMRAMNQTQVLCRSG